jgi:hypothetical protein
MAASGAATGVTGNVVCATNFATYIINVYEWTATWTSDFFPTEVFGGTEVGHTNYRGMYQVEGTIKGFVPNVAFPHADMAVGDAAATITLTERTGKTWTGTGFINDVQVTVNRRTGLNEYSAKFISDGDWTGA